MVALLNSSKEAAERSKREFHLNEKVKVYGSSEELAKDEGVDLVVVFSLDTNMPHW